MSQTQYDLEAIIVRGDANEIINTAQRVGKQLAEADLGNTQVRNIFGMVRQMQTTEFDRDKLRLMIPKLDYVRAKSWDNKRKSYTLKPLTDLLTGAIQQVEDQDHFEHFVNFFEAIVAYHYASSSDRSNLGDQGGSDE